MNVYDTVKAREQAARTKYGCYTSTHEAYGVLAEEVAELLDAIRSNRPDAVRREAIDVAACALKLAVDCTDTLFQTRSGM